jgi:hypothetical protein
MPVFDVSAARAFGLTDEPGAFGHLTSLEIGGDKLDADITVEAPIPDGGNGGTVKVVGPLELIAWGSGDSAGPGDPIYFSVDISSQNQARVAQILNKSEGDASVKFSFVVYDYDMQPKTYFAACEAGAGDKPLSSHFRKRSTGEITLEVAEEAAPVAAGTMLFHLEGVVEPEPIAQTITLRSSSEMATAKQWGIKV